MTTTPDNQPYEQPQQPTTPPPIPPIHYYPTPQPQPPRRTSGLAVASLVLGIVWMLGLGSLLAVVLGHAALSQINRTGEEGRGLAIAGLILGYIGVVSLLIFLLVMAAATGGEY